MKAAVIQMNSNDDVDRNLQEAESLVHRAAEDRARLVVLPECFSYLGPEAGKIDIAESLDKPGPILNRCLSLARECNIELLVGGFWEESSIANKVHNTSLFINEAGKVGAVYRKIHLFDVSLDDGTSVCESATQVPGDDVVVVDSSVGTLGLSICYDVRFPEMYRKLVDCGATALAVPAAFTQSTGKDHWHVLLRARAIESQCYVFAAAQTGHHFANRHSYGHALICDPWGCVLAECGAGPGFASAEIDLEYVAQVRKALPSLRHRRLNSC